MEAHAWPSDKNSEEKGAPDMSSVYTQLNEADLKLEKDLPAAVPVPVTPAKPRLTSFKIAIFGSYLVGAAALLGAMYVYDSLLLEAKQRRALESNHAALSDRTAALEAAIEEQRAQVVQIGDRLNQSIEKEQAIRNEIRREIDKRRVEILNLQKKLEAVQAPVVYGPSLPALALADKAVITVPVSAAAPAASVQSPTPAAAASKLRILTVNKQFRFVVVNMGMDEGIKVGDKLKVLRNGGSAGMVQIEKLYDNFSAAAIVEENANAPMEVGDGIARLA